MLEKEKVVMCCESCLKYERCEQNYDLKDDCCSKCGDYKDCVGMNKDDKNELWKRSDRSYNDDY